MVVVISARRRRHDCDGGHGGLAQHHTAVRDGVIGGGDAGGDARGRVL